MTYEWCIKCISYPVGVFVCLIAVGQVLVFYPTDPVKTSKESNYSHKKNDLYLASKGGIALRKSTASYYIPDEIVKFLIHRGLESVLQDRSDKVSDDVVLYKENPSPQNRQICIDRIVDIQILDPTMGSGYFLVEALNRLTSCAMEILKNHPTHPLLDDLEKERDTILRTHIRYYNMSLHLRLVVGRIGVLTVPRSETGSRRDQ